MQLSDEDILRIADQLHSLPDRIQGFSTPLDKGRTEWGAPHYIRDVALGRDVQVLWRGDSHEEMMRQIAFQRLKLAIALAQSLGA